MENQTQHLKKLRSKIRKSYVLDTTNSGQEYRLYFTEEQTQKILKLIASEILTLKDKTIDEQTINFWKEVVNNK